MRAEGYERAVDDERHLQRIADACGETAARTLDELWWLTHPDDAAPSGAASPRARIRELQHRAYAPGLADDERERVTFELRDTQAEIDRRRAAVVAAVASVSARVGDEETEIDRADDRRPWSLSRGVVLLLAAGAALIVGFVSGSIASQAEAPSSEAVSTAPPVDGTLRIVAFDLPQTDADIPQGALAQRFDTGSFRLVRQESWGDAIYVARDLGGVVCLIVVHPDGRYVWTTAAGGELTEAGLQLFYSSADGADAYVDWRPDSNGGSGLTGTVVPEGSPRVAELERAATDADRLSGDVPETAVADIVPGSLRLAGEYEGEPIYLAVKADGLQCIISAMGDVWGSACGVVPFGLQPRGGPAMTVVSDGTEPEDGELLVGTNVIVRPLD